MSYGGVGGAGYYDDDEKPPAGGQSKAASWAEAAMNVAVGASVALAAQLVLFPQYGIHIPLATDLWLTFWFTLISLARSYVLRRVFNNATVKGTP